MKIEVLAAILTVVSVVLMAMLYRTQAEAKRLKRIIDDFRAQKWDIADASEIQKSMVRHDLKGYLNRIQGLTEMIRLSELNLEKDLEEQLEMIEQQCKEGKNEIDRMLPKDEK